MNIKPTRQLDKQDHRLLTIWASDCAEHVLPYFEDIYPEDDRPRRAIEVARAWVRGGVPMIEARKAAFASHAATRSTDDFAAQAAARAAGPASATAHVADHGSHAAAYAIKATSAVDITGEATAAERDWQVQRLPEHLLSVVLPP